MIAWLKGQIIEADDTELIINTNGVGYRVLVGSNQKRQGDLNSGEEVELAIYTSVKEDGIRLFGFRNFFVRKVFVLLLNVSGIGPKVALSIVDQLGVADIIKGLRSGNAGVFTSVSGVGNKTAQRIILDLQGKMELLQFSGFEGEMEGDEDPVAERDKALVFTDAVSALSNLGFSVKEAEKTIAKYHEPSISLDELIRKCLADLKTMA